MRGPSGFSEIEVGALLVGERRTETLLLNWRGIMTLNDLISMFERTFEPEGDAPI